MRFRSSASKIFDRKKIAFYLTAAAAIASISLVISTGETIQFYVFSLINGDSTSIYNSAYHQGIIAFPTLRQWLMRCTQWQLLAVASVVVLVSLRETSARAVFIFCLISTWISLLTSDLLSGIINKEISVRYVVENGIADACGALIVATIFLFMTLGANFIYTKLKNGEVIKYITASMTTLFVGLAANIFVYYSIDFLYRPLPVNVDIVTSYPVSGFWGVDSSKEIEGENGKPNQFFPGDLDGDVFHWNSPTDNGLQIEWRSLSNDPVFDLTIVFFADCFDRRINSSKSNTQNNSITLNSIKELKVVLDAGMSEFDTLEAAKMWGRLNTNFGPTLFKLDHDNDAKKVTYTQFVDSNATMKILNGGRELVFFVNAALTATAGKGLIDSNRTLNFEIDGKKYSVRSELVRARSEEEVLKCRTLVSKDVFEGVQKNIAGSARYFGVLFSITKRQSSSGVYGIEDNELTVRGGNGWVTLTRSEDASSGSQAASLDFLSFEGSVVRFDIDGVPVSSQPIDQYHIFGDLTAQLDSPKNMRFVGKAKALWKNGVRLNPTKWEKLSWEPRLFLMSLIVSVLGISRYLATRLKENADIQWLRALQRSTV